MPRMRITTILSVGSDNGTRPYGSLFVGGLGAVLIFAAVAGYFMGRASEAAIAFAVIGAGLVSVAALMKRLIGTLKIGPTGVEATIRDEIVVSEHQIAKGQVVDAKVAIESQTLGATVPAEPTLSEDAVAVIAGRDTPAVLLTQNAKDELEQLSEMDRRAVYTALKDLGKTRNDLKLARTPGGVTYKQRKVGPDLRLIYRLIDKIREDEPDQHVIVAVDSNPTWRVGG